MSECVMCNQPDSYQKLSNGLKIYHECSRYATGEVLHPRFRTVAEQLNAPIRNPARYGERLGT